MWERECIVELQNTQHRCFTEAEAKRMWQGMASQPQKFTQNHNGPRGALQIKVKIGDYDSSFSEANAEEELSSCSANEEANNIQQSGCN